MNNTVINKNGRVHIYCMDAGWTSKMRDFCGERDVYSIRGVKCNCIREKCFSLEAHDRSDENIVSSVEIHLGEIILLGREENET